MRSVVFIVGLLSPTVLCAAEPAPAGDVSVETSQQFNLGGAAARATVVPDIDLSAPIETSPRRRLALPLSLDGLQAEDVGTLGQATVFMGEGRDDGRDAVELGTYFSRGSARAGVSITFLEQEEEVARSEVFVDYSLTDQLSVGISGIFNDMDASETVPQIGLSAEYATESGAYLQGGFADAPELDPVFGLSVGFRF